MLQGFRLAVRATVGCLVIGLLVTFALWTLMGHSAPR